MGLPKDELWVTNVGYGKNNEILLSAYKPIKKEDGEYYRPPDTPLGYDMWIPNCLDLKQEEGVVRVEIVETKEEIGLWLICVNDYFGDEQHLFAYEKPTHLPPEQRFGDYKGFSDWNTHGYNSLHVDTKIRMVAGDGPLNVRPIRKSNKKKWYTRIFGFGGKLGLLF